MTIRRARVIALLNAVGLNKYHLESILSKPGSPENRAQLLNITGQYPPLEITAKEAERLLEVAYCIRFGGVVTQGVEESRRSEEWTVHEHLGSKAFPSGAKCDNDEEENEDDDDSDDEDHEDEDEKKTEEIVVTNDVSCPGLKFRCREKKQVEEVTLRLGNGFIPAMAIEAAFSKVRWQYYGTDIESYFAALTLECLEIAKAHINDGDVPVDATDLPAIKTTIDPDSYGDSEFDPVVVSVENLDELKKALHKQIATDQATTDSAFASWIRANTPEAEGA